MTAGIVNFGTQAHSHLNAAMQGLIVLSKYELMKLL